MDEEFLRLKLQARETEGLLRRLRPLSDRVDFFSNDYLGMVTNALIGTSHDEQKKDSGATGSRLLSGNYALIEETETAIARFHQAAAGLIFNSGYDANMGLLATVARREDTVLYDELSHASIRDGLRLSLAKSFSFSHNDPGDLEHQLKKTNGRRFVITESVFSMDGHLAPLREIAAVCEHHGALLIVDEAHATGVVGDRGEGLVQQLGLQEGCFARIHTFGKAIGTHGAIILGSRLLRDYLINFCRPFIYTTALPAKSIRDTGNAYTIFPLMKSEREHLRVLIGLFREKAGSLSLCESQTAIQGVIVPGNEAVAAVAEKIQNDGFDVRPIMYPTVPKGSERLRIVLHSFNTEDQVGRLCERLVACL